ncbi:MAG: hypothetical protein IPH73_14710 [Rhodocyclales bacterium]|nr:hypothetical protein [Rhodocyclales bacterium]
MKKTNWLSPRRAGAFMCLRGVTWHPGEAGNRLVDHVPVSIPAEQKLTGA